MDDIEIVPIDDLDSEMQTVIKRRMDLVNQIVMEAYQKKGVINLRETRKDKKND